MASTRATFVSGMLLLASHAVQAAQPPTTVSDAVRILIRELSEEQKYRTATSPPDRVFEIYGTGLGRAIRNNFGLWRDNESLLEDCGGKNESPEACSWKIFDQLYRDLRSAVPQDELNALSALQHEIDNVRTPPAILQSATLDQIVQFLNNAIKSAGRSERDICVVSEAGEQAAPATFIQNTYEPLQHALDALEMRYGLIIVKKPPKIVIGISKP